MTTSIHTTQLTPIKEGTIYTLGTKIMFPEYECPVHGKIGRDTFGLQFLGEDMQTFCIRCIRDKLIEVGIQQVRRV